MTSYQYDVFLSYAREDIAFAQKFCQDLRHNGISVWFDEDNLKVGERWMSTIKEEINKAQFFIAVISSESVNKQGFVQQEIQQAINIQKNKYMNEIFILPLRINNCQIPYPELSGVHCLDMFPDYADRFNKLINNIWTHKSQTNLEIVGFDLGHGETAVAVTRLSSSSEPQIVDINGKNSIITAVALSPDQGIVIGDDAYCLPNSEQVFILFKSHQLDNPGVYEPVELFIKKYLQILSKQGKARLDHNTWFIVGSPSGWTEDDRNEYEKVLRKAGMNNVIVRAESRAAFLDARESRVLEETFGNLADSVLIIDIGSSTTDFTIVQDYQETPLDFGHNSLGGSQIDMEIFNRVLNSYSTSELEKITNIFSKNPSLEAKCKLKCREVKEKYFSKESGDSCINSPVKGVEILEDDDKNFYFEIRLCKKDMEEILKSPIKQLGKSWSDAFREKLQECKTSKEFQTPKILFMTGGGSRMRFTHNICQQEFPEAKIIVGLDPALTVAKGLALVGRTDFKIKSFRAEVDEFIESQTLKNIIEQEFPTLFDTITNTFLDKFLEIGKSNFRKWLKGDISTINMMQKNIKSETERFFNREGGYSIIENNVTQWLHQLGSKIKPHTENICNKYGIPRTTFNLSVKTEKPSIIVDLTNVGEVVGEPIAEITGILLGMLFFVSSAAIFAGTGFIGVCITVIIGLLTGFGFATSIPDWTRESVKNTDFPLWLRDALLSDNQMNKEIEKKRPELEKVIQEELVTKFQNEKKFREIFLYIKRILYKSADEAAVVIRRSEETSIRIQ